MARGKANMKSYKQDMKKKIQNKQFKSRIKTSIKKARLSMEKGDLNELETYINLSNKLLDRAQYKKIYHRNKVARNKRSLTMLKTKAIQNKEIKK